MLKSPGRTFGEQELAEVDRVVEHGRFGQDRAEVGDIALHRHRHLVARLLHRHHGSDMVSLRVCACVRRGGRYTDEEDWLSLGTSCTTMNALLNCDCMEMGEKGVLPDTKTSTTTSLPMCRLRPICCSSLGLNGIIVETWLCITDISRALGV